MWTLCEERFFVRQVDFFCLFSLFLSWTDTDQRFFLLNCRNRSRCLDLSLGSILLPKVEKNLQVSFSTLLDGRAMVSPSPFYK